MSEDCPFYCYRLPDSGEIVMGIQQNPVVAPFNGFSKEEEYPGFLITPFLCSNKNQALFIREDFRATGKPAEEQLKRKIQAIQFEQEEPEIVEYEQSKEEYLEEVSGLIRHLKKSDELLKLVYSRVITVKNSSQDNFNLFQALVHNYPDAFVYCFYLPGQAIWMGATPEVFLQVQPDHLHTVALAGTKRTADTQWSEKEYKEQEYVSRFIHEVLDACSLNNRTVSELKSIPAGECSHLCTDFSVRANRSGRELEQLIRMLHPTPAVCGYPQKAAMIEILKRERHNRQFYSGFLGPVSAAGQMELFVNLRCLKIRETQINLFVGGGITKDSNPQEEWEETVLKAQTLEKWL